jgi:hypothetical protein
MISPLVILLIGAVWLILEELGMAQEIAHAVLPWAPRWTSLANLWLCPIFGVFAAIRYRMPGWVRVLFVCVFLCSMSLLAISAERYPTGTPVICVVIFVDAYFVIPLINRRVLGETEAESD